MWGADGAGPGAWPERQWDVALSFAGAQRDYVEQVARDLKARGVRCFYDADEQIELWGKYLAEELPAIYGEQAAAVVMFVSAEYAAREWTRLERRTALARAVRERREYVLPARFDDTALPGLQSDMVTVDLRAREPEQFAAMIADKLAALAASAASADAGGPARSARPAGAVRVSEADPRRLGVHAAISVPGVPDEVLPEYVPRDVDAAGSGVRAKVAAAAEQGGFVLLIGGSSVGKTRSAVEAVKDLLPDWWLVHSAGPAEVAALAAAPPLQTVVWLDELQRYLDGEHGLTGGVVRALLNAPHPAVIIGTLWPDRYAEYTTLPASDGADPHAREREVLDLADVVRISAAFSSAEQNRARAAAAHDRRLRVALESAGYGLTQTLAAAPQLVARWEDAQSASPYAWAVLTAALDAARLDARAPLGPEFLRAAAPGYLTSQQQAEAPKKWFKEALAYATTKLHGAASALSPAGTGMGRMGQVSGYTVADYLIQHATRERRSARVPASTWDAILNHVGDPADAARLAYCARRRLLYRYAIALYRQAADAGDRFAARELAELLAQRGDLDEEVQVLRAHADGDRYIAQWLADLLAERGDLDEAVQVLRHHAYADDEWADRHLARLLEKRGDLDEAVQVLRPWADGGDRYAAKLLAELLGKRGDLDGLRTRARAGDWAAAERLAELLAERGDLDEAVQVLREPYFILAAHWLDDLLAKCSDLDGLRTRADAGDEDAARRLADLLADGGDLDRLHTRAAADKWEVTRRLGDLLAKCSDLDWLRTRARAGDWAAARRLADLLAERGDLDEAVQVLRAPAAAGDREAARRLAELLADLLAQRGDLDGLRARADANDLRAAERLAELLAERGDLDELRARADADDMDAEERLAELLAERGDLDGLRARADAEIGGWLAAKWLAELLARRGDLNEAVQVLRPWAGTDIEIDDAARRLADLLAAADDFDGAAEVLRPWADLGWEEAAKRLAELLAQRGDLDGLRARADADDMDAEERLAELLAQRGDLDGLRARADAGGWVETDDPAYLGGNWCAARQLADLLAQHGDLDELRFRAGAGDKEAEKRLTDLLNKQGQGEEAQQLRRFGLNPDGSIACA